jgi:hypothetical protein
MFEARSQAEVNEELVLLRSPLMHVPRRPLPQKPSQAFVREHPSGGSAVRHLREPLENPENLNRLGSDCLGDSIR